MVILDKVLDKEMELIKSNLGNKIIISLKGLDKIETFEGFLLGLFPYMGIKIAESFEETNSIINLGFFSPDMGIEFIKNIESEILYRNDNLNYKKRCYRFTTEEDINEVNRFRILKFGKGHERDEDYLKFDLIQFQKQ